MAHGSARIGPSHTTRNALLVAATLLTFLLLGLFVPMVLGLEGGTAWLVRGTLLALGVLAALGVLLYLRARSRRAPEHAPANDIVDSAAIEAARHLVSSGKKRLGAMPVVLVLGPSGSAKTTSIMCSGLEPELLAGEAQRAGEVLPTRGANFWFAADNVLVEAGGALAQNSSDWDSLVRHLRPSRLAAVLPRVTGAPRVAVVCFGCDQLLDAGASAAVQDAAHDVRARLLDVARRYGRRLPVYVLFTKADHLGGFGDYVRNFASEEAKQVLGATLELVQVGSAGAWTARESERVTSAFEGIFRSLAQRRVELLARDSAEDVRAGAYEFPGEFGRIVKVATRFLVDLCRPSHLGVSPFLRGFYFVGRAVVPDDVGTGVVVAPALRDDRGPAAPTVPAMGPGGGDSDVSGPGGHGERWLFLPRLFSEIVLGDRVARSATAEGVQVRLLRRALLAGGLAALLLLSAAFFASWRANGQLLGEAVVAARNIERIDLASGASPSLEDLERLDALREQLVRLRSWEMRRPPLSHRWGLYVGAEVQRTLRPLYFEWFDRLLWASAREQLLGTLDRLPEAPSDAGEYDAAYNALKAHLITTSHSRESTVEFLTPELLGHWRSGRQVDDERAERAARHFAFFASELLHGNPFRHEGDAGIIERTREFLGRLGDLDHFYQSLIAEASRIAPEARLGGTGPVSASVAIRGAYTAAGWHFVQSSLGSLNQLLGRERWVLGRVALPEGDHSHLAEDLRTRYVADYIARWQEYLSSARVASFDDTADAVSKLHALTGPQSPLLQLLALVSDNTAVDSALLGGPFQPVHVVVPPGASNGLIVEGANQSYMRALVELQVALDQLVAAQASEGAVGSARTAAERIKIEVRQIAQRFEQEGEARVVASDVERILLAPVRNTEDFLAQKAPPAALRQVRDHINFGRVYFDSGQCVLARTEFQQAQRRTASLLAQYPGDAVPRRLHEQVEQLIQRMHLCGI